MMSEFEPSREHLNAALEVGESSCSSNKKIFAWTYF